MEGFLRVNLLGPGPRLMKKEFSNSILALKGSGLIIL
jgi:hypothetical protein